MAVIGRFGGRMVSPWSLQSIIPSVHTHSDGQLGGTKHSESCVMELSPITVSRKIILFKKHK